MDQPLRFAGDLDLKMLRTILERLERGGLFAADIVSYDSINALRAAYEDMPGLPLSSLQRRINLHGVVVTADAMHSQRAHAGHVTTADGHYLLVAKGNQKKLCKQLRLLPWRQIPLQNRTTGAGHGRREARRLKGLHRPARPALPPPRPGHGDQASPHSPQDRQVRDEDRLRDHQPPTRAGRPEQLAELVRNHQPVEALHHVRDVTYGEDAS